MKILSTILWSLAFVAKAADTNALPALTSAYGEIPPTFLEQHGTLVIIGFIAFLFLAAPTVWKILQPKPATILPPEIVAREALEKLLRQPEDGKILSEVSQILRRYVAAAFELSAAEMTTKEFCTALAASKKISVELAQDISNLLRECDDRKFSTQLSTAPLNAAAQAIKLITLAEKYREQTTTAP